MAEEKIVIIGAGPCGLGAGYRLNEAGYQDWVMLEAAERGGGLAKSVIDSNGFLYDLGVHQIYSHYEYFDNVMDTVLEEDKWFTYIRDATVRMRQRYVPYPFQYNVRYLDESEVMECLAGLLDVHEKRSTFEKPANFKEWIYQSFGAGLAKIFMIPYNYKTWAITSDKMACGWMGERVATVNLKRLLENIVYRKADIGWGPNATFKYPKRDGSGAVWDAVLHSLPQSKVRFNAQIKSIHTASKTLTLTNGEKIQYDKLLSTLPADILLRMLEDRPEWHPLADKYYHSSVHLFGLGIEGVQPSELKGKFWIYVPEEEYIFHRVTVMSNYSIYNVPKVGEQWSLLIEVSESKDRQHPQFKTVDELKEEVIEGLVKVGLLPDRKEIVSEWYHRLDYAYPTPFLNRDDILHDVQDKLLSVGIRSRGRFGGWKYEVSNQDHSFMQGVEAADSMLYNTPEVTYFTPAVIEGGSKIGKRPSPQELALNKK